MNVIDPLRSVPEKVKALLDEKNLAVGGELAADHRTYDRLQYQFNGGVRIEILGSTTDYLVHPYNISEGGIGFLHGIFLYPGSRCTVHLKTPDNKRMSAPGVVVRCTHVSGKMHDVGVKFDEPIKHGWYDYDSPTEQGSPEK